MGELVSIITPCYNGEKCVHRLFDSIISQTYRPIEFILINDGSTDKTQEVAESYRQRFEDNGIQYYIIEQENKGLGGAINAGLKLFTGDYLCWPDADDYLEKTSVEERVKLLKEKSEYAVVSSDAFRRDINHLDSYLWKMSNGVKYLDDPNQFEHLLNGDAIFCCGCHMVRTTMFLKVHPDRRIYPSRYGQNWQLLLPIYYKYKWFFLDRPLYNYIIAENSLSHKEKDLKESIEMLNEQEKIIIQSLKKIETVQNVNMSKYIKRVKEKYSLYRLRTAVSFQDLPTVKKEYKKKKEIVGINFIDRVGYLCCRFPKLGKIVRRIRT